MTTLEDIAKALGTTKGTVSKALRGASDVSAATRSAVLEKAVELGYTKIPRQGEGKLCVLVENMAADAPGDFGHDIIEGFRKAAEPAGFTIDIVPLNAELEHAASFDRFMLQQGFRGALVLGLSYADPWSSQLQDCRTPMVLLDWPVRGNPSVSSVGIDNEEGMLLAVAHLRALGHRKIGYLSASLGSYVFQRRYLAFFHALKQHHLPADHSLAKHAYHSAELLHSALPALIRQGCTAVICSHDALAYAVLARCREDGISVPGDLSVIGFDDLPYSEHCFPALTTIRQDRTELGKSAFVSLSCRFAGVSPASLLLHAELVTRRSSGPAPHT